ncbi:MAG: response regulator, partial [Candidatus Eisenbacteria bacterium]|nr:response regulator [Candidatus Eisenbacteria bacterium]
MMHKRVLAVDDDAMNLLILREILEEECDLQTVDNGQAALEAARTFRPDLILLDIMMPGMSGLEVCRAVRAEPSLRFIKIILVSAKASLTERLEGYDAGADDYVIKPFDGSELLAKVRVFCSLRFMEETDQIKSDFLTVLAHETRTPLTRIVGAVAVLGDLAKSGDTQQFLQIIDQASGQIQYLLDRILLILSFRMSASAGVLPPQPISQLCRPAWANGRSEIATSWGAGTEAAVVQADPRHLAIAFEALHRFARAWHENQGEVSLRTEIEGKEWVMTLEGIA